MPQILFCGILGICLRDEMIEKLKNFIIKAGLYSLEQQGKKHLLSFKSGDEATKGLVTEVDMTISHMFKDFVDANFADLSYMIIDEESIASFSGDIFEKSAHTDYQFVIDPIDGTMNYAADIPMYGITIGVLKHGKPWLGLLYAPVTGELLYTDGRKVFFEYQNELKIIEPNQKSTSRVVLGHAWRVKLKPNHFDGKLIMHDYFSAVIYCLYVALGRVRGAFIQANLWDVAGGWAICKLLGMGFYDYETGCEMDAFKKEFFREKCQVRNMNILCYRQDFDLLKDLTAGLIGKQDH